MTKTTKMSKNIFVNLVIFLIFVILLGYFLVNVFSGRIILSQSFSIGSLTIHYYGIIMAVAAAAGFYLALVRANKYGINQKTAEDLFFWAVIGGFVGARIYHVVSAADHYLANPAEIIKVWNGGLGIYGAILGGMITIIVFSHVKGALWLKPKSTFDIIDWLTPSLILGQIIGRFGNLFNYEAFGYPTNLPWKMFVPAQFRPENYLDAQFFHPWFLYEALGNLFILIFILKFKTTSSGRLFFWYLLLYNVLRFLLEFIRIDSTFIGPYRLSSAVSLVLIMLAAGLIKFKRHYG